MGPAASARGTVQARHAAKANAEIVAALMASSSIADEG
jgi:hypothetical protein